MALQKFFTGHYRIAAFFLRFFSLLFFPLFSFFPFPITAQENAAEENILEYMLGRVDILYRLDIDDNFYALAKEAGVYVWGSYTGNFPAKDFWYYSVEAYLNGADNVARVFRSTDESESANPLDEAAARNIPVFVDIKITGDITAQQLTVRYIFTDLFSDLHTLDKTFTESIPTEDDLLQYYWLPVKTDLDDFIKPILKPLFTIRGPVGAEVSGFTKIPFTISGTGSVNLTLPMPGTFQWKMTHKKYTTRTGSLYTDKDRNEFILPAQRFYPTSIDIGLFQACFPELWISRYLKNGWFFSIGLQQQFWGIFAGKTDEPLKTSFNTVSLLLMPGVGAGYVFHSSKPYVPEFFLQTIIQARLTKRGNNWFNDFSPANFSLYAGYEWETPLFVKLFAEIGASLYLLADNYKDSVSKGTKDKGFIQKILNDTLYIEFPCVKLGIKLELPF
jgi:hypothetical protein